MRILVISNLYPPDVLGGYEMGCRQVVDALRTAGHDVYVLCATPRVEVVTDEPHVGRLLHLSDIYDQYSMWKVNHTGQTIRRLKANNIHAFNVHILGQTIERFEPDVVYAWNLIGLGGLGLLATVQHMGLPWVMHLMDDVPNKLCSVMNVSPNAHPELADIFNQMCKGRFICCSKGTLNEIESTGLSIAQRTAIIPNWIDIKNPPPRNNYLKDGTLRIICAGTLGHHKGSDIAIEVARRLRDRGQSNFVLDFYGMGTDPQFQTMIQSANLTMVNIKGNRSQAELSKLFLEYDVFLFPTWEREPFAFTPMEAMAHGCLVVMSRICGNSEWFIDGVDCLKADRSVDSMAHQLERILNHDVDIETIAQRGAQSVIQWFHLSDMIPKIVREFEAAIDANDSPRNSAGESHRIAQLAEKMLTGLIYETAA